MALRLAGHLGGARIFVTENPDVTARVEGSGADLRVFRSLKPEVARCFNDYSAHVFFMAAGIVVRTIAPLIGDKTKDPAVVSVDDRGRFAVSLLSGHIGGANRLAEHVASVLGSQPVITTASDVNGIESVDMMAVNRNLGIENPGAIKTVNMAFLTGKPVGLHDPYGYFSGRDEFDRNGQPDATVWIDDRTGLPGETGLLLRPRTLVAGMGCNRGTDLSEIRNLLLETMVKHGLSPLSIGAIASVDVKNDEPAIRQLAGELNVGLIFFSRDELKTVQGVETPSEVVEKHVGVSSVCEAAAILGAGNGDLIVPKHKSLNATVAVARISSIS
jgi:cobalt-precorrin 5A hydrolase